MFKKLSPSNPKCEMNQENVDEWADADKGNKVLHTIIDDDLINAVMKPNLENKNFLG
jgi:hypothetical protein